MKRLEIKNFEQAVMGITSDFFHIKYCSDREDKYIMAIEVNDVVSYKPLESGKHYMMSIDKKGDELFGGYSIWLWDMGLNISYPMSIDSYHLSNSSTFTSYLNHTLELANDGRFNGSKGNMVTN